MLDREEACDGPWVVVDVDNGVVAEGVEVCRGRQVVRQVWVHCMYSFRQYFLLRDSYSWVFACMRSENDYKV